jgi:hypothetical protein
MNVMDLLSGELVKRREAMPQESLGSLMGMLSQGANAPSLPAMSNHGSGLGSSILKQFVSDKMGKAAAEDQAASQLDAARPGIDYARNAPQSYTDPNTGTTTPLSPLDQARYWQASPDASSRKMGQSMMEDILKPSTNKPGYQTMGMPGREGYKTNALVGPDGSLKPIGEPWQDKSGVTVNTGDMGTGRFMSPDEKKSAGIHPDTVVSINAKGVPSILQAPQDKFTTETLPNGGMQTTNTTTGKVTIEQPSEAQAKAAATSKFIDVNNNQYNALTTKFNPAEDPSIVRNEIAKSLPNGPIANSVMTKNQQQYRGIKDRWNEKFLRDESGASISPTEYVNKERNFWPVYGDSEQVVADKAAARKVAEEGVTGKMQATGSKPPSNGTGTTFQGRALPPGWVVGSDGKPRKQ